MEQPTVVIFHQSHALSHDFKEKQRAVDTSFISSFIFKKISKTCQEEAEAQAFHQVRLDRFFLESGF
jgi:hypothetical protein